MDINEIPVELLETMPVEDALRVLKFDKRDQFGNPQRNWGVIEVIACPWPPLPCLLITIRKNTEDIIYLPQERRIALKTEPIEILAIIYNACKFLFEYEDAPKELRWGELYSERRWAKLRQEEENRPKVWVEREFFRFCLNYIAQYNDWSAEDYDVDFTYSCGQLKIKARNMEVCCPARGTFYGTLTFSARQLYRYMPKRFIDTSVFIVVMGDTEAMIASHILPAKWTEKQIAESIIVDADKSGVEIEGLDELMKGIGSAFGVTLDAAQLSNMKPL